MEEKQESHKKKPFVEPNLIKGERLYEVTFQPAGYAASSADTVHHSLPFSSTFLSFPVPGKRR